MNLTMKDIKETVISTFLFGMLCQYENNYTAEQITELIDKENGIEDMLNEYVTRAKDLNESNIVLFERRKEKLK